MPAATASAAPDSDARSLCVAGHQYLASVLGMEVVPEHEALFNLFPHRQPGVIAADSILNRLILWPRGVGKSTCVATDIVQAILHNLNIRILYSTSDDDLAKARLQQIAGYFDNPTEKFRSTFPALCGLERRTVHQFTVKGRTNRTAVNPTCMISTPDSDTTGSRFDLIVLDDIVTFPNSRTESGRQKAFEQYRSVRSQRSADGQIIVCGTCYDPDDAYARIEKAAKGSNQWLISRRSCWSYRCQNCGHKDLFHGKKGCYHGCRCSNFESDGVRVPIIDRFVTRHGDAIGYTTEWLENERSEAGIGARNFALQYENDARENAGLVLPRLTDEAFRSFFGKGR